MNNDKGMLIIGERINATRKSIREAILERDAGKIAAEAVAQVKSGAQALDVNAGFDPETETGNLLWLVGTVLDAARVTLCLDSTSPEALDAALEACRARESADAAYRNGSSGARSGGNDARRVIINSISGETGRYSAVIPLVREHGASVIALCMDDGGMPADGEKRVRAGTALVERLLGDGVPPGDIFLDPLVVPVGVNPSGGKDALDSIGRLKSAFPDVKVVLGASNVSFGMPRRSALNAAFVAMAALAGADAAIVDPLDDALMSVLKAALALAGRDPFCAGYIEHFRKRRTG
ncbi:MAG: dihydropteroate synthase [bacterium]